jgi:hypothetical protein
MIFDSSEKAKFKYELLGAYMKRGTIFLAVIVTVFLSGCATLSSTLAAKGTGTSRIYQMPFEKVWNEMPSVVSHVGLTYVQGDVKEGYVLAERGVTGFSWGEKVAIFITPQGQNTNVEIVTKPVLITNITSFHWTWGDVIFAELDKRFAH